jgi:hypothetical protein
MTAGVESPRRSGALGMVTSGWRLVGSFRAATGPFLTVVTGSDRALNGQAGTQRVNQVLDDPYADMSTNPATGFMRFLNPAAFAQPALGTLGTMERNSIEGKGSKNVNLSLSREFRMSGSQMIEVRAEAFNAFNWTQWLQPGQAQPVNTPTVNLSSPTFGQITAADDSRIMQFAVRYTF